MRSSRKTQFFTLFISKYKVTSLILNSLIRYISFDPVPDIRLYSWSYSQSQSCGSCFYLPSSNLAQSPKPYLSDHTPPTPMYSPNPLQASKRPATNQTKFLPVQTNPVPFDTHQNIDRLPHRLAERQGKQEEQKTNMITPSRHDR